ncbi:MAG: nucleotide-binding domain containing protein, partial [Burkholderiaceae bacterium]
ARAEPVVDRAVNWARERLDREPVLLYATTGVQELEDIQAELGVAQAGALVEAALAQIARRLLDCGVQRIVVAGGETSGAVVQALRVEALRIGAPICPGVPWTQAQGRPLWLALKSGNFGGPEFFADALKIGANTA